MAQFIFNETTTVAEFKASFNAAFGSKLKLYNGGRIAEDSLKLTEIGLKSNGQFECRASLTVASFISKMADEFGLKVKVYTCDEWVACLDGLTLESTGKVKKNAVKADMENLIAYQRETAPSDEFSVVKNQDGSYTVSINGDVQSNAKGAMRQIAEAIGFEYDPAWTTQQFGSKLSKALGKSSTHTAAPQQESKVTVKNDTATADAEQVRIAEEQAKAAAMQAAALAEAKAASEKAKAAAEKQKAEAEAAKAELERLKAETAKAKAEAETAKAAAEKARKEAEAEASKANPEKAKEEKQLPKSKSKDPFDGLMVKVCAGIYVQNYIYSFYTNPKDYYPNGDKRKKMIHEEGKWESRYTNRRRVTISKEFAICKYQVTQGQWKAIMGEGFNPSYFRGDDNLPVESVTLDEVQEFINKLNSMTGKKYRLPTEAEWEWAAKGASKDDDQGLWAGCSEQGDLEQYSWYSINADNKTHPVGKKKPNELGLYDMTGNVWEICEDNLLIEDHYEHYFGGSEVKDPCVIMDKSNIHILKGGAFDRSSIPQYGQSIGCLISCYGHTNRENRSRRIGLRLALTID